jgi:hypothetical protein
MRLTPGEHYFHVRRRPVFKWSAIVAFIEQGESREQNQIAFSSFSA